jgi:hypothetical protein
MSIAMSSHRPTNTPVNFVLSLAGAVAAVLLALALVALVPATSFAAPKIGVAAQVQNQVNAIQGPDTRSLRLGNDVFSGDRIRTGQSSNAQLMFLDQTNLTIGAQSDVVLDRFVFDPNRGAGSVALSATQGALRFISGSQNSSAYRIDTPLATITVRGTLAYWFGFGAASMVANGDGHVSATTADGKTFDIPPGFALIILPGAPPQTHMVKWDLGLLDLDRLAQVLPQFLDLPDGGNDLNDAHDAAGLPPFINPDIDYCYFCVGG